jgi:hypothetical protein
MINLGCGRVTLPGVQPWHHSLVDGAIYSYPHWHNVDRNPGAGVDEVVDVFTYPWPWADNSFSGALLSHLAEHIPHAIHIQGNGYVELRQPSAYWTDNIVEWRKRGEYLAGLQDGWFAFFSELWRVLEPGAIAHILCPHGHSDGALADPTHTRYVMPHTFGYLKPDERSPFDYARGCHFDEPEPAVYRIMEVFQHLVPQAGDTPEAAAEKQRQLTDAMMTRVNVVYEFYVRLRAVKDANHD